MIANIPTHARARATIVEKWPRSSLGLFSSQDLMGKPAEIKMVMNSRTMTTTDQTDKLALKLSLPVNVRISWPTLSMVSVISRREDRLAAVSPKSDQVFRSSRRLLPPVARAKQSRLKRSALACAERLFYRFYT
jgi:hypothetical protein